MKLRILDDAIRLRLARSEVDAIGRGQRVEAVTHFPGGARFVYSLATSTSTTINANLSGGRIDVIVPFETGTRWAANNDVAIEGEQSTPHGVLHILIEKDFECLEPRDSDDPSDRYPNPKAR